MEIQGSIKKQTNKIESGNPTSSVCVGGGGEGTQPGIAHFDQSVLTINPLKYMLR